MRRRNLDLSWESLCVNFSGEFLVTAENTPATYHCELLMYNWTLGMALQYIHTEADISPLQSSKNLRARSRIADAQYCATIAYTLYSNVLYIASKIG
jgi:hypothetical protein